jgi:hypothetical protein
MRAQPPTDQAANDDDYQIISNQNINKSSKNDSPNQSAARHSKLK